MPNEPLPPLDNFPHLTPEDLADFEPDGPSAGVSSSEPKRGASKPPSPEAGLPEWLDFEKIQKFLQGLSGGLQEKAASIQRGVGDAREANENFPEVAYSLDQLVGALDDISQGEVTDDPTVIAVSPLAALTLIQRLRSLRAEVKGLEAEKRTLLGVIDRILEGEKASP